MKRETKVKQRAFWLQATAISVSFVVMVLAAFVAVSYDIPAVNVAGLIVAGSSMFALFFALSESKTFEYISEIFTDEN